VAVGARPFLIAWNINLASADRDLAVRIARRIRESGGGLPKVQANGFMIEELGRAQVSMNLLDFAVTPMWVVWETVRDVAAEDGVELAESELIGLAPVAALLDVADRAGAPADDSVERRLAAAAAYLRLRDFSPLQALELRLEAARSGRAR
jgi:glutamate formiminotransferase